MSRKAALLVGVTLLLSLVFGVRALLTARGPVPAPATPSPVASMTQTAQPSLAPPRAKPKGNATVEIPRLIAELHAADRERRFEIVSEIVAFGGAATPMLLEQLTDENRELCPFVASVFVETHDARAVPRLLEAINWARQPQPEGVAEFDFAFVQGARDQCAFKAIDALGWIRDARAVESLLAEIARGNTWPAGSALGQIGDARAIEPLLAALPHDINGSVAGGLLSFGNRVVAPARAALAKPDPARRRYTLRYLSEHALIASTDWIAPLLKDREASVRLEAVRAVERLRGADLSTLLWPSLQDADSDVSFAAATALFRTKDRRAIDPLATQLTTRLTTGFDAIARNGVADAWDEYDQRLLLLVKLAGELGHTRTVEALTRILGSDEKLLRATAAETLGKVGDQKATPALVDGLADWRTGPDCAKALTTLRWRPVVLEDRVHLLVATRDAAALNKDWATVKSVLLADLTSVDARVVESAAFIIVGLGRSDLVPDLVRTLEKRGTRGIATAYLNSGS